MLHDTSVDKADCEIKAGKHGNRSEGARISDNV